MSYLKKAKLFIFPSIIEAMSNMLLEAVSVKTPIICSDILENKAVFDKNEILFFSSEDSDDLTEKIKWALQNPVNMKLRAEKAYKRLVKNYNWSDIASQYDDLYQKLL